MDKRQALKILIEYSNILAEDFKRKLIEDVADMSDEEVDSFGKFLAKELDIEDETYENDMRKIDEALEVIEGQMEKREEIEKEE
ncbi:MAG TPA: hypothetical protein VJJ72_00150 [Candidatus Paceibacterota bacterium]